MYQSQKSFQTKSLSLSAAMPRSYFCKETVTSRTVAMRREMIQRSAGCSLTSERGGTASSLTFMRTKRAAFHTLLMKLREASTLASVKRVSLPGATPVRSERRKESAPYLSMTSSGSMPLPRDLLILRPCSSRTSPWMSTSWKGTLPVCSMPENIMRITQNGMMS